MAEKRDSRRQRKRLSIKYGLTVPEKRGFTEDISRQGLFIKGSFVYPPRTLLTVEVTGPAGESILLKGTVMWAKKVPPNLMRMAKKAGMGIRIKEFLEGEGSYQALFEK